MNAKQKLDAAMERVEHHAMLLLKCAHKLGESDKQWDYFVNRKEVLSNARSYSDAVRALARVRP